MTVEILLTYVGSFISSIFQIVIDFRSENADVCLANICVPLVLYHITLHRNPHPIYTEVRATSG